MQSAVCDAFSALAAPAAPAAPAAMAFGWPHCGSVCRPVSSSTEHDSTNTFTRAEFALCMVLIATKLYPDAKGADAAFWRFLRGQWAEWCSVEE